MSGNIIKEYVNQSFREAASQPEHSRRNPVMGGDWPVGADPIGVLKKEAHLAMIAREWFYLHGPRDAPPLPLSAREQADLRYHDPLGHLIVDFTRSLEANGWEINNHPSFEEFARGVLASEYAPDFTRKNEALLKRYPPRALAGIGPGQVWRPEH